MAISSPSNGFLDLSDALPVDVGYKYRQIGSIPIADVTVEEDHDDELIITMHPVEQGAIISDHAYKRPAEVRVRCAWNNSRSWIFGGPATDNNDGKSGYAQEIYQRILDLQQTRQTFDVYTGKRVYNSMLVANIRVHTAPGSEYTLLADIALRQVILVATKLFNANASAMSSPETTQPTSNEGKVSSQPVSNADSNIAQATPSTPPELWSSEQLLNSPAVG